MNWNSDNRVAENYPPIHCSNPPKVSWGLRKPVVTGPQEYKFGVRTVCILPNNNSNSNNNTNKDDKAFCKFKKHNITKTNEFFYAGVVVVTNRLGVKINKVAERKKRGEMRRRRLQNKVEEMRKDLSQLESSKDKVVSNVRHWQTLERKCSSKVTHWVLLLKNWSRGL